MQSTMNCQMKPVRAIAAVLIVAGLIVGQQFAALLVSPAPAATLEEVAYYPTLIAFNGKIATVDSRLMIYESIAVRGERIWKLGTDKEIKQLAGPQTKMVDLKGRTVVPGLIDVHTHPHLFGLWHLQSKYVPELEPIFVDGKNAGEVVGNFASTIKARIKKIGPGKWIYAAIPYRAGMILGTSIDFSGRPLSTGGQITRKTLDKIAPDNPLVVVQGCCVGLGNTKAREIMIRETGYEHVSVRVPYDTVYGIVLKGKTREVAALQTEEMREIVKYGITTIGSHGEVNVEVFNALSMMDREGTMPLRFGWHHESGFFGKDPAEFYRLLGNTAGQGSNYLWNVGVGWEVWDSFGDCLSARPKTDIPLRIYRRLFLAPAGPCIPSESKSYQGHLAAAKAGLRLVGLHSLTGDRIYDRAFDLADEVISSGQGTLEQIRQQRWGFDHNWWVRPDQIPKIKKYGFWLNFQATQFSQAIPYVTNHFGEDYLPWVMPVRSLVKAGVKVVFGTDIHIGKLTDRQERFFNDLGSNFPYRDSVWPWVGTWVTRELHGKVWQPEERIDRITALKGWTINAAGYLLRENDLGSLEIGKLADFIVLDRDYFSVPDREIKDIQTLMTILGGKVVYQAADF